MNIVSLYDGISCGQLALRQLGIEYTYYASEIDERCIAVTQHYFPNTLQLGDCRLIRSSSLPPINLLMGGSPCQSFSVVGFQKGLEGESGIIEEFFRLKDELQPRYFLLENVPMKPQWREYISNRLGVEPTIINSNLVSAQNRKRLYWTNIPIAPLEDRHIYLKDIIEEKPGGKRYAHYIKESNEPLLYQRPRGNNPGGYKRGKSPTLSISSWQHNNILIYKNHARKLTPEECEKLQTIPVGYTNLFPKTHRYKMIGNAWTVDVIAHILQGISI